MTDFYDRKRELIELSAEDNSEQYSIDENGIYYDPRTELFVWLSASGCSCWDGEYSETTYDTLEELIADMTERESRWQPASSEVSNMAQEARFIWNDIKDRLPDLMDEFQLGNNHQEWNNDDYDI